MDLDRNLRVGRIHVPAGKHLGSRVPMHFLHWGPCPSCENPAHWILLLLLLNIGTLSKMVRFPFLWVSEFSFLAEVLPVVLGNSFSVVYKWFSKELFLHAFWSLKKTPEHRQLGSKCSPLFWPEFLYMPLPASIGHLHVRTLQVKNWSQNASLPNTQARVLGGIFAPTRRATNHEVIYREVVFIKLSFFLSHSSVRNTYKGRML